MKLVFFYSTNVIGIKTLVNWMSETAFFWYALFF